MQDCNGDYQFKHLTTETGTPVCYLDLSYTLVAKKNYLRLDLVLERLKPRLTQDLGLVNNLYYIV